MLPFKAPNPFFFYPSSKKPPLYSVSLSFPLPLAPHRQCQEFSRLFSQLGGWKSDTRETWNEGMRGWGAGGLDCRIDMVEFQGTEAGSIVMI